MINVYINRSQNVAQLIVLGHAGLDEVGKDIVCAGVSALAQAYVQSCLNKSKCISCDIDSGRLEITVEESTNIKPMLDMLECGVRMIMEQYPDHVSIHNGTSIM